MDEVIKSSDRQLRESLLSQNQRAMALNNPHHSTSQLNQITDKDGRARQQASATVKREAYTDASVDEERDLIGLSHDLSNRPSTAAQENERKQRLAEARQKAHTPTGQGLLVSRQSEGHHNFRMKAHGGLARNQSEQDSAFSQQNDRIGIGRDEEDIDNGSFQTLDKAQQDRLYIAQNNLKLNVFLNVFLFAFMGLIFSLNWYCHYNPEVSALVDPTEESGVCFKILNVKLNDLNQWMSIKDYVLNGCPSLSHFTPDREAVCQSFYRFHYCFLMYLFLKFIAGVLNIHSIVSVILMITDDGNTSSKASHRQVSGDDSLGCIQGNQGNQGAAIGDNRYPPITPQSDVQNPYSMKTSSGGLFHFTGKTTIIRTKLTKYATTDTLKWAIAINFLAIIQWLIFTKAIMSYQSIGLSPILDLVYCFTLLGIRFHQQQWEEQLQVVQYLREYI